MLRVLATDDIDIAPLLPAHALAPLAQLLDRAAHLHAARLLHRPEDAGTRIHRCAAETRGERRNGRGPPGAEQGCAQLARERERGKGSPREPQEERRDEHRCRVVWCVVLERLRGGVCVCVVVGSVGSRASGVRGAEMGVRGVVRIVVVVVVAGKIGAKRRQRAGVMGAALGRRRCAGLLDWD
jgi:plasmid stabilization system protein ParE